MYRAAGSSPVADLSSFGVPPTLIVAVRCDDIQRLSRASNTPNQSFTEWYTHQALKSSLVEMVLLLLLHTDGASLLQLMLHSHLVISANTILKTSHRSGSYYIQLF
jgi:hypothetical protein